ncbi:MAG: hypothetical protein Q4B85_08475 [Lachnospiraceae bacterium]|nr:hypothetical protein [Lachnospiraceae bacterium]
MSKAMKRLILLLCVLSVVAYVVTTQYANREKGNKKPEFSMEDREVTISVADPKEAIFQGVTVKDKEDGDVTDSLLVESLSNMASDHTRSAVIAAFDKNGNVAKTTRTVVYSDYVSPTFTLNNPLTVQTTKLSTILEGVQVEDVLDGDISDQVQLETEKTVEKDVTDNYKANLLVTNSAGDTVNIPVTVTACTITDMAAAPSIELDTYLIYLNKGDNTPSWKSFLKSVTVLGRTWLWDSGFYPEPEEDGSVPELRSNESWLQSSDIKVKQDVDTSVPGVYEVKYYVKAYKANPAASVRLFVVVRE